MKSTLVFIWIAILAGCTSVQRYDGPKRPDSEIVILEKESSTWGGISVREVNGEPRGVGTSDRYEMLPGIITLEVYYVATEGATIASGDSIRLKFTSEAGKKYVLKYKIVGRIWIAWVEDKASKIKVSEIIK